MSFSITCVVSHFCVCVSALVCPANQRGKSTNVMLNENYACIDHAL